MTGLPDVPGNEVVNRYLFIGAGDLAREITVIAENEAFANGSSAEFYYYTEDEKDTEKVQSPIVPDRVIFRGIEPLLEQCSPQEWKAVCCIGKPRVRERFYYEFCKMGFAFTSIIAGNATVETTCMGPGTVVFPGARLALGCRIGCNAVINYGAIVGHDAVIGDHSVISPGVSLGGRIEGGKAVLFGIGSSILENRSIGDYAVLAAGSSAWMNVPADSTVVGVPATRKKIPGRKG